MQDYALLSRSYNRLKEEKEQDTVTGKKHEADDKELKQQVSLLQSEVDESRTLIKTLKSELLDSRRDVCLRSCQAAEEQHTTSMNKNYEELFVTLRKEKDVLVK